MPAASGTTPDASGATPAAAASAAGWRIVFTRHYGTAANFSLYLAIVALRASDA
jgi:hypothetical protein